jgi:hypothetical protein
MKTNTDTTPLLYIGLDVHKEKTSIAIADPGATGEIRHHGEVATTQRKGHPSPEAGAEVSQGGDVVITGNHGKRTDPSGDGAA